MDKKSKELLNKLDELLVEVESEYQNHSEEILNAKPSLTTWSIIQNMWHLIKSEELSRKYIEKKLSFNPTLKTVGTMTKLKEKALVSYLRSPVKVAAPAGVNDEELPDHAILEDTLKKWKETRVDLNQYLENLPDEFYKKEIYKHPFAGRLSIYGMLLFFVNHMKRHMKQMSRTLKAVKTD